MQKRIKEYFENHRNEILDDIASLIEINSVRGDAKEGMPFGEGPAKAVAKADEIAKRMGFITKNFENYVLTVNHSEEDAHLGILCHLDVVAEGTGWSKQPFKMVEEDGKIYGRGTSDDKGPAVAALWALKACDDLGIKLNKNVRIILGADEECGSSDLRYYFKKEAAPAFCISPDAEYPVFNCEKGGYKTNFRADFKNDGGMPKLLTFNGGHTANIVAQHAEAVVEGMDLAAAEKLCKEFSEKTSAKITAEVKDGKIKFVCEGTSSHASIPQHGNNAITALIFLLSNANLADSALTTYVKGMNQVFPHGDYMGRSAGIEQCDEVSGILTCSFDILTIKDGHVVGTFDIRSPICANEENTSKILAEKLGRFNLKVDTTDMLKPHYVSEELPFIQTLIKSYEDFTGLKGGCCSMGGGTYVHNIENGVAFGPTFPGTETNIHGADEFAVVDELLKTGMIYTQVIADMCK